MRIYAVADIHGKTDNWAKVRDVIDNAKPDILVIAGDIFNYRISKQALDQLCRITIPVFGVRGNSDPKFLEKKIQSNTSVRLLNPLPLSVNGIDFVGLNGTLILPFFSKVCLFESGLMSRVINKITPRTVLVGHPPPRGYRDRVAGRTHCGSSGIKKILDTRPPMMVLCGHIHEQAGIEYFKNTPIINCAMNQNHHGAIIECTTGKIETIDLVNAK